VTFDPFGDFESRGYLRNLAQEKDPAIVRRLEHASFTTGIDDAFEALKKQKALTYSDVLSTHKTLFEAMYPWAGQDRTQTAPNIAVSRGSVLFAHPKYIQNAIEHALKLGNDPKAMREKAGEVMGYLAHGHPFLDGNGRTIMVVHSVLAQRAGFSVDWASTDKTAYLRPKSWMILAREFSINISNRTSDRQSQISKSTLQRPRASMAAQAMPIKFAAATTIRQL